MLPIQGWRSDGSQLVSLNACRSKIDPAMAQVAWRDGKTPSQLMIERGNASHFPSSRGNNESRKQASKSRGVHFFQHIVAFHCLPVANHDRRRNADGVTLLFADETLNSVLDVAFVVIPTG